MATVEQVQALPGYYQVTIPPEYLDDMRHMNVRWYLAIMDENARGLFDALGMNLTYFEANNTGAFALQQFIHYRAEVRLGETVSVHSRMLARTERKLHMMHYLINDTRHNIAATIETLSAHADLSIRRTAPFPPHIAERVDQMIGEHRALDWEVERCGAIRV